MHSAADLARFDLDAYLRRIDYAGPRQATRDVLQAVHEAHATRIPFENLDVLLGRAIRLDLDSLQAKLVRGGRGGYCFEQNALFAAALQALGFALTPLAARVRLSTGRVLPRTHMLLLVDAGDARWIADVGFGAEGLLWPVAFAPRSESRQFAWAFRVADEDGLSVMQSLRDGAWSDLYAFTLEPQLQADFEPANHYVSTHPDSRFVQTLTVQRVSRNARTIMRNRELIVDRGTETSRRLLAGDDELLLVLAETFGLSFPDGTRFRFVEPSV